MSLSLLSPRLQVETLKKDAEVIAKLSPKLQIKLCGDTLLKPYLERIAQLEGENRTLRRKIITLQLEFAAAQTSKPARTA